MTRIYNGIPSATTINNTDKLPERATALYMVAPDTTSELEVDFYLQFELSPFSNRLVKLNDTFVMDTVVVYPIPLELQGLDYDLYGAFTTSLGNAIEIYAIERPLSAIEEDVQEILDELKSYRSQYNLDQAREIAFDVATAISQAQQNIAIGLLATSLSPLTLGGSLTALPPLTTSNTSLLPILGGALLP